MCHDRTMAAPASLNNNTPQHGDLWLVSTNGNRSANIEGHKVLTDLEWAAISFARSGHNIINGCRRYLVGGEKNQMRVCGEFRLGLREHLARLSRTGMVRDDALDNDIFLQLGPRYTDL